MGTDFAPFPLAVAMQDMTGVTFEVRRPDSVGTKMPPWGNECLWTDPPPAHCFPDKPDICRLVPDACTPFPNGPMDFTDFLKPGKPDVGKVVEGTDLTGLPPKLIAIIRVLDEAMNVAKIDLDAMDIDGLTIKIIDKR